MSTVAVVSAMEIELSFLDEALGNNPKYKKEGLSGYKNIEYSLKIEGALLGIGKVNAAYRTAEIIRDILPDLVINVGFAGGMLDGQTGGDVVIGNDYVQVDFIGISTDRSKGLIPNAKPYIIPEAFITHLKNTASEISVPVHIGRIATGDFFLGCSKKKIELQTEFSPVAFDMESAAVAHVCAEKGIPFVAVRTLSDMADDEASEKVMNIKDNIERRPIRLILHALESLKDFRI